MCDNGVVRCISFYIVLFISLVVWVADITAIYSAMRDDDNIDGDESLANRRLLVVRVAILAGMR